ncbi:MAG TPA: hypothetical protein DEB17_00810 [Chlorobaculum sp.]|jgi:hypothetical protein|uniref:Uncharacterized protein n=1 Tax=Chlorobaculum tepidum (strain ATCC 49652 / DSM 12025 / NBRC 103806 / TLS) TaxID=194439 RepID=Q8KBU4_CHLTE|nr:hypothetical protein [Chlorobaculum tepidum]AAM72913.1 hypothetical protein CT1688 [Chlorobaculum tepidum TLS]HBU22541.1 hypothetical protein [Chlorobaculum sp.]
MAFSCGAQTDGLFTVSGVRILFLGLEKHTAAFSDDILTEAGTDGRIRGIDGKALTLLALLTGLCFLFVHDLHIRNTVYRFNNG